jgi:hypothetical protein
MTHITQTTLVKAATTGVSKSLSILVLSALILVMLSSFSTSANAAKLTHDRNLFTLVNLERERAALISLFLNSNLSMEKKLEKLSFKQRQLADMERMVLRDERLLNSDSKTVKRAFGNYDMTFLVHAGAEKEVSAMQQWMLSTNLSNAQIMDTTAGYR